MELIGAANCRRGKRSLHFQGKQSTSMPLEPSAGEHMDYSEILPENSVPLRNIID